jgi:hypothetical protein
LQQFTSNFDGSSDAHLEKRHETLQVGVEPLDALSKLAEASVVVQVHGQQVVAATGHHLLQGTQPTGLDAMRISGDQVLTVSRSGTARDEADFFEQRSKLAYRLASRQRLHHALDVDRRVRMRDDERVAVRKATPISVENTERRTRYAHRKHAATRDVKLLVLSKDVGIVQQLGKMQTMLQFVQRHASPTQDLRRRRTCTVVVWVVDDFRKVLRNQFMDRSQLTQQSRRRPRILLHEFVLLLCVSVQLTDVLHRFLDTVILHLVTIVWSRILFRIEMFSHVVCSWSFLDAATFSISAALSSSDTFLRTHR